MSIGDVLISLIDDYKKAKSSDQPELPLSDSLSLSEQTLDKSPEGDCLEDSPHVSKNRAPPSTLLALSK